MDRESGVRVNINGTRRVAAGSGSARVAAGPAPARVATGPRPTRMATGPAPAHVETRLEAERPGGSKAAPAKRKLSKLRKISIAVLVVGILVLAGGGGFLAYKLLNQQEQSDDAAYLVEIGTWQRKDEPSVVWKFTAVADDSEAGKGSLTTNDHVNDYDFAWILSDDQLAINTDWLYELNDNFTYDLDQQSQTLTLTTDDDTWTFVPASN